MSESNGWSDEQVQAELEAVLADLRTLKEHLAEPLTLTDSIAELETTLAVDEQTSMGPTMPECSNCGTHVTEQYMRVFADNTGTLHACPNCRSQRARLSGAGAGLPVEVTHDN